MQDDLDIRFGKLRDPEQTMRWERNRVPNSLSTLNIDLVTALASLEKCAQCDLLRFAAQTQNYLWAMDESGAVRIAVEEIAVLDGSPDHRGYPRRRGYRHPSEDMKLGHPTLVGGGTVRIAGELALDIYDGRLSWVLNANSGRYCKQRPPSNDQVDAVADLVRDWGLNVRVDYL